MNQEQMEPALVTGALWHRFCDTLRQAGDQVLRPEAPADPATRAEGFRYLSRLLRIGLEMHLEYADPDFPGFIKPSHETAKIGADNPDNLYLYARLNGDAEYRIRGRRNSVHYLSLRTQKGGYESDGRMIETGFIDAGDLILDAEGNFEIIVSAKRQPGNWLPMDADTNALVVRQTFHDRSRETAADVALERIGADAVPQWETPANLGTGLLRAADFVAGTARLFADWSESYLPHPNRLPPADQALCQSVGGDPNIFYYHGYWTLAGDEALVIEVDRIPDCETWNLQVNNYWMESLDYRHHRVCINKHNARYREDGGVSLVLSHRDPGMPNWLQTAGHREGTLCFRWVGAANPVHPRTRVVKLDRLPAAVA